MGTAIILGERWLYPNPKRAPVATRRRDLAAREGMTQLRPMALVVFLRGVNVGGHRTFRPSLLAKELRRYDVVNIGAAGTLVVRGPVTRTQLEAALRRKLPFDTHIAFCDGRELLALESERPFGAGTPAPDVVRFVSILSRTTRARPSLPVTFPTEGEWLVRVLAAKRPFVFGEYRRHFRTIGCLGQIDTLFGAPATTRNWNTILAIARVLRTSS
jgi:uncharacterized protein (DUF1697 family)